jgi:hypothetical protein
MLTDGPARADVSVAVVVLNDVDQVAAADHPDGEVTAAGGSAALVADDAEARAGRTSTLWIPLILGTTLFFLWVLWQSAA